MKLVSLFLIIGLTGANPLFARIGESLEECYARYGKRKVTNGVLHVFVERESALVVMCAFGEDGKCHLIEFTPWSVAPEIEEDQIDELLEANSGGLVWVEVGGGPLGRQWATPGGERTATYFKRRLVIIVKGGIDEQTTPLYPRPPAGREPRGERNFLQ